MLPGEMAQAAVIGACCAAIAIIAVAADRPSAARNREEVMLWSFVGAVCAAW